MTKNFENRVIRERTVDTKNYRYIVKDAHNCEIISRLQISKLGTTAAIDGWEIVKVVK